MAETKKTTNNNWYVKWSGSRFHALAHWGIFLIIAISVWSMLYGQIGSWMHSFSDPGVSIRLAKHDAVLALEPQTASVKTGDEFAVNIVLDTASTQVDGVDIYSLHYDPTLLRVIDDVPGQAGVQIKPGQIMPLNAANIVDPKTGTIKFGQVSAGGTSFDGKGVLATIHFEALLEGTAYLNFDFSQGSTVDSNAAFKGKDQLKRVIDAVYKIDKRTIK